MNKKIAYPHLHSIFYRPLEKKTFSGYNTLVGILFCVLFFSCHNAKKSEKPEDIVLEWTGREIKFPSKNIHCSTMGVYQACDFKVAKPFKILVYTDSASSKSCKLRLDLWKDLIKEADTVLRDKVDFLFYFPKDEFIISEIMKREYFKRQVFIDEKDELNAANKLPKEMDYQCFLLDKDNKVLLVGNPTLNSKIWDLDKKLIKGEKIGNAGSK